jgi:ubiquinone/menaquinone biosynthesis C-methylase UbiE
MSATHEPHRYVKAAGFDFLTPFYDWLLALTTRERAFRHRLIAQAAIENGHRVLDVGCGTGTLAVWIRQAVPGAVVTGIDGDEKILAIARRKAQRTGLEIRFDHGMSFELPYADASFERVVSTLMLHHLTRDEKLRTLREIGRVLVPDGELHVADFGPPSGRLARIVSGFFGHFHGTHHAGDYLDGSLPKLFEEAGLEQVRHHGDFNILFGTLAFDSARSPAA